MDIDMLTEFFKYCTVINAVIILISTLMSRSDSAYSLHVKSGLWKGSKEAHSQLVYSLLGNYKILIIMLNAVPYFALCCLVP